MGFNQLAVHIEGIVSPVKHSFRKAPTIADSYLASPCQGDGTIELAKLSESKEFGWHPGRWLEFEPASYILTVAFR